MVRSVLDRLARRWESLPGGVQFLASFPVTFVVFFLGHVYLLNQPVKWRGVFYGVFWGLLFSLLIVFASWNEARKRYLGAEQRDGEGAAAEPRDRAPV
jgi:hypothetical protein